MSKDDVYREIESATVIDKNGLEIGRIADFTYTKDENNNPVLRQFVVKGENPVIKEWLDNESKYSLLLPEENIRRQKGKDVFISVSVKELETIHNIGDDEQRFTVMRNVDVIADDGEDLGLIVDAIFHKDNHFSLILGDTTFNRFLSRIGITSKNNLFVPYRYVDRFDTNLVKLNQNKKDLTKMIDNIVMDTEGLKLHEQQKLSSHEARMELYNESFKDVVRGKYNTST